MFSVLVVFTEPGAVLPDKKLERYFKQNRKDLANVKSPMGLGTPCLRSNFCYSTKKVYARYETHSYLFMGPIAARNAGYYFLFYLNELLFCLTYLILVIIWTPSFWSTCWWYYLISTFVFLWHLKTVYYKYKKIYKSMKYNVTFTERLNAHKNPVFMTPHHQFYNPFDRGFVNNIIEFFMPCPI